MKKIPNAARAARRELLATTVLATLAVGPAFVWPRAHAQTVEPAGHSATNDGAVSLPQVDVAAMEGNAAGDGGPGTSAGGAGLGGRFTGYNVIGPAVAGKTDIPILLQPFSIQVVPREVLDDQQDISVQDAIVGNVSSVQPNGDNFYDGFTIRGIPDASIFRQNLKTPNITHLQTANLQSIEVLKGPAAMLFGRLEPGGVVNLVVKRPLLAPYYSVQEQAGSWGLTRTSVDATGPLTEDKTWLYRVNLSYLHSDSFRDFVTNQDAFVAPTLTYHPIEQFRLNIDAEYQNTIFVADTDDVIPAIGAAPAPIPITRYLMDPAVTVANPSRMERKFIGYDWTFDIAADWSLTNRFAYSDLDWAQRITNFNSVCLSPGTAACTLAGVPLAYGALKRRLWDVDADRRTIASNLDLTGKFDTGPFKHSVLIGTDFYDQTDNGVGFFGATPEIGPINMFAPTYRISGYVRPENNFFNAFRQSWRGVYAQDMISFADDKLHLLVGGRYDWANYGSGSSPNSVIQALGPYNPLTGAGFREAFDKAFSPRLGAVVQPTPWLSFYGSYSQSFGVTNARPVPGQPAFPPQEGRQWEGGAKAEFFDKRLTATVAFYDITKSNVVQTVPGTLFAIPVGLVRSRGAEFDIVGRINENWSLIGNYSFDEARIEKDAINSNVGHRLQNVPLNAGNIWVKYDADGDFRGLSLGGGLNIVGERQGDNANDFQLPAYTLVNALVMYRFQPSVLPWVKNLTAQLNVKNLFDTTYYLNSFDRFSIAPGAPRTFLASIRAEF